MSVAWGDMDTFTLRFSLGQSNGRNRLPDREIRESNDKIEICAHYFLDDSLTLIFRQLAQLIVPLAAWEINLLVIGSDAMISNWRISPRRICWFANFTRWSHLRACLKANLLPAAQIALREPTILPA